MVEIKAQTPKIEVEMKYDWLGNPPGYRAFLPRVLAVSLIEDGRASEVVQGEPSTLETVAKTEVSIAATVKPAETPNYFAPRRGRPPKNRG